VRHSTSKNELAIGQITCQHAFEGLLPKQQGSILAYFPWNTI